MKATSRSALFYSADRRTLYVQLNTGETRRVERWRGELVFVVRIGKARKKANKLARMAAR